MKYNEFKVFRKDLYRTVLLIWDSGKALSVVNVFLLLLQAVLPVASLYFIKVLLELLVRADRPGFDKILPAILGFSIVQFLLAVAIQFTIYINTIQLQRLTNYLSEQVFEKAVEVDLEYYENPEYHDTLHMAQQQSIHQAPVFLNNINALILNSLSLLLLIGFFFKLQWFYAVIFVAVSIPLACIKWYYGYRLFKLDKKYVSMERETNYYHQVLTGVTFAKEVRSFGIGSSFIEKYKTIRDIIYKEKQGINKKFTVYSLIAQAIEVIVMVAIFVALAKNAWLGIITVGVFIIYLQGFQRLQAASKNFLQSLVQIFQQRLFLKDIFAFFDIAHNGKEGSSSFPAAGKGLVAEHLSFTYPHTGKQVLHDVSISCPEGGIIAIVGENGSGKSTLVKLLAKMYAVQSGSIRVGDADIRDIADEEYRKQSIFLFQDFEKFFLTVEENIALAKDGVVNTDDVRDAARVAGIEEFVKGLHAGYQTRLGRIFNGGAQLSGGQWQKLALARTFYKNARLIVLDEPTSSIDAIAEYEIFENLKQYAQDRMVILISHRLYNLRLANIIYVMKDGAVAEKGSFEELIARDGIFREMYNKQKL